MPGRVIGRRDGTGPNHEVEIEAWRLRAPR
jgi:hypothetical protein